MITRRALFRLLKPVNAGQEGKDKEYQQNAAHDADTKKQGMESQRPAAKNQRAANAPAIFLTHTANKCAKVAQQWPVRYRFD
ncbi:Uncharacterised protein [Escherichia coli]|nr:Uncharacterised protein [Escherichia coli]